MATNNNNYTLQNSFDDVDLILSADIEIMQQKNEVQGKTAVHALYLNSAASNSASNSTAQMNNNKCTSPECLARLIVYILELQGSMPMSDLIRFLQVSTGNDEIALVLRVHFKGLLHLVKSFKQLFCIRDETSYNPFVCLSDEFIAKKNALRQHAQMELARFYHHESSLSSNALFSIADDADTNRERTSSVCTERVSELSMTSVTSPDEMVTLAGLAKPLPAAAASMSPPPTSRSGGSSAEEYDKVGVLRHSAAAAAVASSPAAIVLYPEALAHSIVCILEEKGPLKVGEVGKLLQVVVAPDGEINLAPLIKSQFKGLKKLIEGFRFLFWLDAAHPYNPTVHLTDEYSAANAAQNSVLIDSYFTFEPVNTLNNVALASCNASIPHLMHSATPNSSGPNYAMMGNGHQQKIAPPATAYYSVGAPKNVNPSATTSSSSGYPNGPKKQLQVSAPAFVMTNVSGGSCNGLLGKLQKQPPSSTSRSRQMNTTRQQQVMMQQQYYSSQCYDQSSSASQQYNYERYSSGAARHVSSSHGGGMSGFGFDDTSTSNTSFTGRRFGIDSATAEAAATRFDGSRIELYRDYFNDNVVHPSGSSSSPSVSYQRGYTVDVPSSGDETKCFYGDANNTETSTASPSSSFTPPTAEYSRVLKYLGI